MSEHPYVCNDCGAEVSREDVFCPNCGADFEGEELEVMLAMKYPALRTIAGVYQILAISVATAAIIGFVLAVVGLNFATSTRILILLSSILAGTIGATTLFAAAESIKVFIDIEENTRRIAELLKRRDW